MYRLLIVAMTLCIAPAFVAADETTKDDYIERMEVEHATDSPVASPAAQVEPDGEIVSQDVTYAGIDGNDIVGYLAKPATGEAKSGILVIHEWWGLNDNIRSMARQLAGEGYATLAVDLYEGEVAETREDAGRLARGSRDNPGRGQQNLQQAWQFLKEEQGVEKVGVIGWCFGGGWSLQAALMLGEGIDAAVIYYGRVITDRDALEALASPLLGIFGALDGGIPVATVREFQTTLDLLGKVASIHIYEGADHAFANPSGTRYNEKAAKDAWSKTLTFFGQLLH
jgi:carboxymethylenebutenolidase